MVASAEGKQWKKRLKQCVKALARSGLCHCGEPTLIIGHSRKGLLVLDVIVKVPPVMPHQNLDNSIYKAIP
jgi:hypothetical protein